MDYHLLSVVDEESERYVAPNLSLSPTPPHGENASVMHIGRMGS